MTIGLTWRRTARRIKRLKEGVLTISPDYSDRDPRLFGALPIPSRKRLRFWNRPKDQARRNDCGLAIPKIHRPRRSSASPLGLRELCASSFAKAIRAAEDGCWSLQAPFLPSILQSF